MCVSCVNCGKENKVGSRFCTGCGEPLPSHGPALRNGVDAHSRIIPAADSLEETGLKGKPASEAHDFQFARQAEMASESPVLPPFLVDFIRRRFPGGVVPVVGSVVIVVVGVVVALLLSTRGGGPEKVKVPHVEGLSLEEAEARLEETGLDVGEISSEEREDAEPGTVLSSSPPPGSSLERGSAVDLTMASGKIESGEVAGRVTCPTCFGRGYITCPKCHGQVYLPGGGICDLCHGKREIVCPTCGGTGYVNK